MDEASDEEQQAWEKAQAKRAMAGAHEEPANENVYIPAPSKSSPSLLYFADYSLKYPK